MTYLMLLPIVFPMAAGVFLLVHKEMKKRNTLLWLTGNFLVITALFTALAVLTDRGEILLLFDLTKTLPVLFRIDGISVLFSGAAAVVFLCAGFFSFEYMKKEQKEKRYYGFYLIVYGIINALCFAGNIITFYLFFELLTLSSLPLVLHTGKKEAIMAGLKYLFYSLSGAYMALFGIYFINKFANTLSFSDGGVINPEAAAGHEALLLVVAFVMILGFSVKAGMFPMHGWLPAAHPVAPAPASAVLSAVIVKAGVLAIVRVVYYLFGVSFLRGSWVQTAWLTLTLITVFMGSMLAYREPGLKKRLAYSTVSQVSYILFGLAVMEPSALTGGLLHVICHAFIKAALFLCAGAIIYKTGKTKVEELRGIGKEMPLLMWCYTIVSLGLIGIPPTGGFISKWYLAEGALNSGIPGFSWAGPVILLVSALLTAGYLLSPVIIGFFPGAGYDYGSLKKKEPSLWMTVPVLILTVLTVFIGLFPGGVIQFISRLLEKLV